MDILLVSATSFEIRELCNKISANTFIPEKNFQCFKYGRLRINILITGPGINLTSYKLSSLLTTNVFDLCIQAGISGAFGHQWKLGEVVNVRSERFAQLGAEDGENFLDIFELGLLGQNEFPFSEGKLVNKNQFTYASLNSLKEAEGITVETVHGNEISIEKINAKYNPAVESMEGAAFFYACLMHNIPFIELRAISNYVEKRNKANWNINEAVEQLNNVLIGLVEEIAS